MRLGKYYMVIGLCLDLQNQSCTKEGGSMLVSLEHSDSTAGGGRGGSFPKRTGLPGKWHPEGIE